MSVSVIDGLIFGNLISPSFLFTKLKRHEYIFFLSAVYRS
jgi:hypothetical protein